jgi:hypothetical protein
LSFSLERGLLFLRGFISLGPLLGRKFPDVVLFVKKPIELRFRDDDMANTRQSGNQSAADVAPDLHNRNAQVNGRFFDFESASFAKFMTFERFFEQSAELAWNLCLGVHDANTNTPTYSLKLRPVLSDGGRDIKFPAPPYLESAAYFGEALPRGL